MIQSREQRLAALRTKLVDEGVQALVVTGGADCRYLTGFTGEAASACVTAGGIALFTDPRFTIQAQQEAPDARLVIYSDGRDDLLPDIITEMVGGPEPETPVVGIDPTHLTIHRWEHLRTLLETTGLRWRFTDDLVETCRQVKFPDELDALRASATLVSSAFEYLELGRVIGRTELEVALDLEMFLRRHGSEGVAFPFIVATGARGAMPHAEPSDTMIREGQLVVFDLGAVVQGYASDITRTYATGPIDDDLEVAYEQVEAGAGCSCGGSPRRHVLQGSRRRGARASRCRRAGRHVCSQSWSRGGTGGP